jgi:radical SAM protein with 4Fe4S-binding SPASM domain
MGAIRQCKDLGAKSIVIIGGGEPTIQPEFRELISYIFNLGLVPVVFTNGTAIDQHLARFLFEHDASILLKLDSTNADTQDTLAGFRGASEIASTALKSLSQSGYMQNSIGELRLGISFVSTLANASEIPSLWKFCREAGIYPNHELLILRGAARSNRHFLELANERVAKLKEELRLIDRSYGYDWLPYKPLTGCGCLQILYSVYIASDGFVKPCADIDISRFNIRELSVAEILQSDFFRLVRNMKDHLRGKCKTCQHHYECLGCRGAAFAFATLNGEGPESAVTSEDPFCWK